MTRLPITNLLLSVLVLAYVAALAYFSPVLWFRTICLVGGILYALIVQSWDSDS